MQVCKTCLLLTTIVVAVKPIESADENEHPILSNVSNRL